MNNAKELVLNAMDCLKIKCLNKANPEKSTKTDKIPEFEYRRYAKGTTVFTVKEDEGFFEALNAGQVFEVTLNEGTREVEIEGAKVQMPTIEFLNFVTGKQRIGVVNMLGEITQTERKWSAPITAVKAEEIA